MRMPAAVYDIETQDWTTFVLGTIAYADGRVEIHRDERAMVDALLAIQGDVYAHNGGRFDHLWLLDAAQLPASVSANSSGIVSLRFTGGGPLFLDSYRVFPMKLADLTGGAKDSLADLCNCGKKCGGYCRIRRRMSRQVRDRVEAYAVQDSRGLMEAILHFRDFALDNGIQLRHTIGASAWATAAEECGVSAFAGSRGLWRNARRAYHGGRTEVFRVASDAGYVYDINSAYPGALLAALPIGAPRAVIGAAARRAYRAGVPGTYHAAVTVPEQWIPPLPLRVRDGLAFPTGDFAGDWPLPELQYAERAGVKIRDVFDAVIFPGEEPIFAPWVERLFSIRARHGKDSREGKWLKWILNSLTGKLGSRSESRRIAVNPDLGHLGDGWRPLDEYGRVWEQAIEMAVPEECAHPEMASYLTGRVRIQLHAQLTAGGAGDAVYTDTDSAWCENERTENVGTGLGEWNAEGRYAEFQCAGPKTYRAKFDKGARGLSAPLVRAKGIPSPTWEAISTGFRSEFVSFAGLRRANKTGGKFFARIPSHRTVTANTGRRIAGTGGDARTYPPPIEKLAR